ncbi:hypothetical protein [Paenibacillus sp. MMS20-IR301]|uniref:hypothetical protein n=1 Tax=Paenibacillus sp. MMS20-IR301 TaxID=2895946 RepID=UPI0028EAEAAF|nr:hypothetical protein [Paenibacillus sp. MMS20-IR301]WNS43733.1 hypothetical protein LOS79_00220 [Paenibacillus sp. MMS20-IR301]
MTRFGKKLIMVGIWAGVGILVGMQFGGGGSGTSAVLPGWNGIAVNTANSAGGGQLQTGQTGGTAGAASLPSAGTVQGGQTYVYVPVAVDPATGAYKLLPVQQPAADASAGGSGTLRQQEVQDYAALSPEQILIPDEQKPTVDVLADKTAGLLQQASQKSIRWVVSLFDSSGE